MTIDATTFRDVMGAVPTTVTVLSIVDAEGADHAMTVGAFTSLSLEPPLVLACIGDDATLAGAMRAATTFGISVLASHQAALSTRFADRDARGFDDVAHVRGPLGTALIADASAHLECRVVARHTGGDHTIVVGEVQFATASERGPLVHHRSGYTRLA